MIINARNEEKINQEIRKAEGKATARTITAYDILTDLREYENTILIPKKSMIGIKLEIDHHAQNFPNAYKYRPESTKVYLERVKSGWNITHIYRNTCNRANHKFKSEFTDEAKKEIIKVLSDF